MVEIIAAVVGVLLGALATWFINRSRPHHLVCEDRFRARLAIGGPLWDWEVGWRGGKEGSLVSLDIGLPQTRLLFKEAAVDVLTVLRLKFRNAGNKMIDHPRVAVKLGESAKILACDVHFEPERIDVEALQGQIQGKSASVDHDSSTVIDKNKVGIILDSIYPYGANQEVAVLDLFCSGEIEKPEVSGQGTFQDGSVWAVKFEPWSESRRRVQRRVIAFNYANVIGLLIVLVGYLIWQPPSGLISVDRTAVTNWVVHPLFAVFAVWLVLFLGYAFYMGMRGWYMSLPMPFLKRNLEISFARKRPK